MKKITILLSTIVVALSLQSVTTYAGYWSEVADKAAQLNKLYANKGPKGNINLANYFIHQLIDHNIKNATACVVGGNYSSLNSGMLTLATRLTTKIPGDAVARLAKPLGLNVVETQNMLVKTGDAISTLAGIFGSALPAIVIDTIASDWSLRALDKIDFLNVGGTIRQVMEDAAKKISAPFARKAEKDTIKKLLDEFCQLIEYEKI